MGQRTQECEELRPCRVAPRSFGVVATVAQALRTHIARVLDPETIYTAFGLL